MMICSCSRSATVMGRSPVGEFLSHQGVGDDAVTLVRELFVVWKCLIIQQLSHVRMDLGALAAPFKP